MNHVCSALRCACGCGEARNWFALQLRGGPSRIAKQSQTNCKATANQPQTKRRGRERFEVCGSRGFRSSGSRGPKVGGQQYYGYSSPENLTISWEIAPFFKYRARTRGCFWTTTYPNKASDPALHNKSLTASRRNK